MRFGGAKQALVFTKLRFDIPASVIGGDDAFGFPVFPSQIGQQEHALRRPVAAWPAATSAGGQDGAQGDGGPFPVMITQL